MFSTLAFRPLRAGLVMTAVIPQSADDQKPTHADAASVGS